MEMKQNQIFFHGTYLNWTPSLFLSKNIKVLQRVLKSKFLTFMTKKNPNNGNETKPDIFPWDTFKFDTISFFVKNIKFFQLLSKLNFLSFMTKVNPNNENETKSDISLLDIFKSDTISFSIKKY